MAAAAVSSWVPQDHLHAKLGHMHAGREVSPQRAESSSSLSQTEAAPTPAHDDPHHLPEFSNLSAPPKPILYLPPLLSTLPPGYAHPPEPAGTFRPLTTETHLPDIDPASLLLHKALHHFRPVTDEYAETPYEHAFNWGELVLPEDAEREWYAVVFQSKRKEGSDGGRKCRCGVCGGVCADACVTNSSVRGRQEGARRSRSQRRSAYPIPAPPSIADLGNSSFSIGTAYHIPRRASTSRPASGSRALMPSLPTLARIISAPCGWQLRRTSGTSSAATACARWSASALSA